jgi:hypothetical protein
VTERSNQIQNRRVAPPIEDAFPVAARSKQVRRAHQPKALRGVCDRESGPLGEPRHAPHALQDLEDFQPIAVAERFRYLSELTVAGCDKLGGRRRRLMLNARRNHQCRAGDEEQDKDDPAEARLVEMPVEPQAQPMTCDQRRSTG